MNDLAFLIQNSTLSLYGDANNLIIYKEINDITKSMLLSGFGELGFEKVLGFKSRKMSLFFAFIEMPVI